MTASRPAETDALLVLVAETRRKIIEAADDLARLTTELRRRVNAGQVAERETQAAAEALERAVGELTVQNLRVQHMHMHQVDDDPCVDTGGTESHDEA